MTVWGALLMASFPLLVVAAALGLARARGAPGHARARGGPEPVQVALGAFVVATIALHVASFGESRFHLPLVPVLAVAASLGAMPLASAPRARLVTAGAVVAMLAVVWAGQAPELLDALAALRSPNGWSTPRPY